MRPKLRAGLIRGAITALLVLGVGRAGAQSDPWIRHEPNNNHGVIVFVHGAMGDAKTTWTSGSAYWPEMLKHDPKFDGQDIYVYHYPSPVNKEAFSIDQLADNMRLVLATDGVLEHDQITIVSHSMGGIVTRAFILRYRNVAPKIRMLYFFATPTTGSPYATLAALVSRNPQFKQLYPMQADGYLAPLQSDWLAADLGLKSYCAYETQRLYGQIIVDRQSATNLCTKRLDPIDADHITIVKPKDQNSTSYRAFKSAFMETAVSIKHPAAPRPQPKPAPKPPLASIRIASQKQVASADPDMPFGLEVVITTDSDISPVAFNFIFSGNVGNVRAVPAYGTIYEEQGGIVVSTPNVVFYQRQSPPFVATTPIVLYIYSKTYIQMTKVESVPFQFPRPADELRN